MSRENQSVWKYEFSFRIENNSLWYNNICCSIGHMSELTWAAASCVDWLFSCMSFCAFEKFIDDTYNRVERRVNAVKSFLFLTSHTAWTVNFVINLLLPTLLLPIKWSTTPNFIQAWPSWRYALLQFTLVTRMQRLDCRRKYNFFSYFSNFWSYKLSA